MMHTELGLKTRVLACTFQITFITCGSGCVIWATVLGCIAEFGCLQYIQCQCRDMRVGLKVDRFCFWIARVRHSGILLPAWYSFSLTAHIADR